MTAALTSSSTYFEDFAAGQKMRHARGTGSADRVDGGLSDWGVAIIQRMNKVGMAVDVSHCGDRTSLDAFKTSKKPVLVTHSNVRALAAGHVRCKPDEVIDAVKKAGSVFGVTGVRMFVKADEPHDHRAPPRPLRLPRQANRRRARRHRQRHRPLRLRRHAPRGHAEAEVVLPEGQVPLPGTDRHPRSGPSATRFRPHGRPHPAGLLRRRHPRHPGRQLPPCSGGDLGMKLREQLCLQQSITPCRQRLSGCARCASTTTPRAGPSTT